MPECTGAEKPVFASFLQLLGRIRPAVFRLGADLVGCALTLEISSGLRGASPRLLLPMVCYCLALEVPLIKEMLTGPKVFLAMPDACRLRPCKRNHFKNGLVPYLSGGGTDDKYRRRFSSPLQLLGRIRPAVFRLGADLAGCALALEISSSLKGPSPKLLSPSGDRFIAWRQRRL